MPFSNTMELVERSIMSDCYPQWGGHPTPQSPVELVYSPSNVVSSEHLSIYVDQNKLHHPSLKIWTPASSNLSDEELYSGMNGTSSHVLERIQPIESDPFGSAEEMFKMREEQTLTREYSMRQTYSFLIEMSSSGTRDVPLTWVSPGKEKPRAKPSRKITPPSDDTWSPPAKETTATSNKHSSGKVRSEDARQASLNKNKVAAAKCRVNKTIQTDKLRESAHTVLAANTRLRQEVMDKMEEIQALHTEVLCHVVDNGCRDPHELRHFLCSYEGKDMVRDDPAVPEQPHTSTPESMATTHGHNHQSSEARLNRTLSEVPAPSKGIKPIKQGSKAKQRTERKYLYKILQS